MKDGITIDYKIKDFEQWRRSVNVSFGTTVDTFETGEIKTKKRYEETITTHRGKWETFDLVVKEVMNINTGQTRYNLKIKGSLHKNYYGGKNYLPFTFEQLQQQINHLCKNLSIDPLKAKISTLEIGVNIVTPFTVTPFILQNLINYKGKYLKRYPENLGVTCRGTQYEVKIYDKGKQNELPQNLMRFELKFFKMQKLNDKGVKYLSDLLAKVNIQSLISLLLDAWNNILIYDIEVLQKTAKNCKKNGLNRTQPDQLKNKEIELLKEGRRFQYWEELKPLLKRSTYYDKLNTFKTLVAENGNKWQQLVNDLIVKEWNILFKTRTNLPTVKCPILSKNDHLLKIVETENPDKFTIKIKGKNVRDHFTPTKKRVCLSCGNDISNQKESSLFCSSKFVGEVAAKQCRNNNSNPRNYLKRKIEMINSRGVLFDIIPYLQQYKS